ncbi:hypothetical protein JTT07_10250 [Clostridium botulinum]|nr:hypothetical protein [Clostridium botulinum]
MIIILKIKYKPREIQGYEREEYTHLQVAAAISNGDAHCGLGYILRQI